MGRKVSPYARRGVDPAVKGHGQGEERAAENGSLPASGVVGFKVFPKLFFSIREFAQSATFARGKGQVAVTADYTVLTAHTDSCINCYSAWYVAKSTRLSHHVAPPLSLCSIYTLDNTPAVGKNDHGRSGFVPSSGKTVSHAHDQTEYEFAILNLKITFTCMFLCSPNNAGNPDTARKFRFWLSVL